MVNIYFIFLDMHVQSAQDEGKQCKQFKPSVMRLLYAGQASIYDQKPMYMGVPHEGCKGVIFHLKFKRKYGNTLLKAFKS